MCEIWFNTLFKLRIYESSSDEFQQLFNKVMSVKYDNFAPVTAYGSYGDKGNDGFIYDSIYFQLYAPKTQTPEARWHKIAIKKLEDDFSKLLKAGYHIKEYNFLINDRFGSIPVPIYDEAEKLSKNNGIPIYVRGSLWFFKEFSSLDTKEKQAILDSPSLELDEEVSPSLLKDVLDYIYEKYQVSTPNLLEKDKITKFEKKLKFNKLDDYYARKLRASFDDVGLLEKLADERPETLEKTKNILNNLYTKYNKKYKGDSSLIFVKTLLSISPHPHYYTAALIVMSKYFESCDIFEEDNGQKDS